MSTPRCPACKRRFEPGVSWAHANYCRASFLLPYIAENPGLSTWELAQRTEMAYADVSRALLKARDWTALRWEEEPKENGDGVRYRYRVVPDYESITGLRCRGEEC